MEAFGRRVHEIVERGLLGEGLADGDIEVLYGIDPASRESFSVQGAGRELSMRASDGKAEIHAQIGLNGTPCPRNCWFCSFAVCNGVRKGILEMPRKDVLEYAKAYQEQGANLLLLLTTESYGFDKLLDMCGAVRELIDPAMPLLANTGDMTYEQCLQLKAVGVNGIYHAVRMQEGIETGIPVERRLATIADAHEAGLTLSTCVEPIGPEHSPAQITEATRRCIDSHPISAGAGKRIGVPGTKLAGRGMISELHAALYLAVYRLATGIEPRLNCSGNSALTAAAGGNLNWAEVGTNPRDLVERTENGGKGASIADSAKTFRDSEWEVLEGFSQGWML